MPLLGPDGQPIPEPPAHASPGDELDVSDALVLAANSVTLVQTVDGRDLVLLELDGVRPDGSGGGLQTVRFLTSVDGLGVVVGEIMALAQRHGHDFEAEFDTAVIAHLEAAGLAAERRGGLSVMRAPDPAATADNPGLSGEGPAGGDRP